jgi:hypothetical protein
VSAKDNQEDTMQWIAIGTPPFTDITTFDATCASHGGEPEGLEARWVGRIGDQLRVIMVWTTREQAERFFAEVLLPGLAATLGPDKRPELVGFAAERTYRRELVSP